MANLRDELLQQASEHKMEADRLERWVKTLDEKGFDWTHTTEAQRFAIKTMRCDAKG